MIASDVHVTDVLAEYRQEVRPLSQPGSLSAARMISNPNTRIKRNKLHCRGPRRRSGKRQFDLNEAHVEVDAAPTTVFKPIAHMEGRNNRLKFSI
jgi:hypothetical protein